MNAPLLSLMWFALIVAAIPLVLWLIRRSPYGASISAASGLMHTVASLPLSPSQRLVLVEVGQGAERRWLVLGVTPQQITPLHTLEPQTLDENPEGQATPQAFARLLQGLQRRPPSSPP